MGRDAPELKPEALTPSSLLSVSPKEPPSLSRSSSPDSTFEGVRIMAFPLEPRASPVTVTASSDLVLSCEKAGKAAPAHAQIMACTR